MKQIVSTRVASRCHDQCDHTNDCQSVGLPIKLRYRSRPILTPYELRQSILDDIAKMAEPSRLRSARRRLTTLDRALSDREAETLDELIETMNDLEAIAAMDLLRSQIRSSPYGRLPFGESKKRRIERMSIILKQLDKMQLATIKTLAFLLNASTSTTKAKPTEAFISAVCNAARCIIEIEDRLHPR